MNIYNCSAGEIERQILSDGWTATLAYLVSPKPVRHLVPQIQVDGVY